MRLILFLCSFFVFGTCLAQKDAGLKVIQGTAQGTTFSISYRDSLRRDFTGEIDSLFRMVDQSMSLWVKNSLISRINRNESYDNLDPHFIRVFDRALEISRMTGGYFDITVGPLVQAWGFGARKNVVHPDQKQVDSLKVFTGYRKVSRQGNRITKKFPQMEIDFNAIAQGYTVDLMGEFLSSGGIDNWLVEVGGEVRAHGKSPSGRAWRVGLEKPDPSGESENGIQAVAALDHMALGTSGSYRKFFEKDGKKYSHSIDPYRGKPVSHSVLSITVLAGDCMTADALAKAFLVTGLRKAKKMARRTGTDFFAIYEKGGGMATYATKGFRRIIVE